MARMFLESINIRRAENGIIVGMSLESDDKENQKFDHKEMVFEKSEDASKFISERIEDIIEKKKPTIRGLT